MENTHCINAKEIGLAATVDLLRDLLVEQFQLLPDPSDIDATAPLFSAGVGLSSLEGLELLGLLEKRFGVEFHDLDFWVDESPSLTCVAQYLVENSSVPASPT